VLQPKNSCVGDVKIRAMMLSVSDITGLSAALAASRRIG